MKSEFVARFLQGGGLSLIQLVTGLIKIKVIATLLGVSGVGLLSLALQFQMTAVTIISMSLAVGVINLGRPSFSDQQLSTPAVITGTAMGLVLINSILVIVFYLAAKESIVSVVFGGQLEDANLWPLLFAAVVVAAANVYGESTLFLMDRFDRYVKANILASFVNMMTFIVAVYWYGLQGAIWATLLAGASLLLIYVVMILSDVTGRALFRAMQWHFSWVRPLLSYSTLMILTVACSNLALLFARSKIVASVGVETNGLLQVITALAAYLAPFVMTGVWGHLHPLAAKSGDCEVARVELRKTILYCARIAAGGCIAVVLSAPILIRLVYSDDFLSALPFLGFYFIGEFLFLSLSVYGAYILAVGCKRAYLFGSVGYFSILSVGTFFFADSFGIRAYIYSHIVAAGVMMFFAGCFSLALGQLFPTDIFKIITWFCVVTGVILLNSFFPYAEHIDMLSTSLVYIFGVAVCLYAISPILNLLISRIKRG